MVSLDFAQATGRSADESGVESSFAVRIYQFVDCGRDDAFWPIFLSDGEHVSMRILQGLISIIKGMKVTLHYLIHPSTVITQQYPENRATLKMPERLRAQLAFVYDENGYHKCTACHICEQNCPNASIHVLERPKSATGPATAKDELDYFVWRLDTCTFCNICVMVCPFSVLKMNPTFESSVYDQKLLVYNLNTYAGPTGPALMKVADPEERKKMIEPRDVYSGPVALSGFPLAGIEAKK